MLKYIKNLSRLSLSIKNRRFYSIESPKKIKVNDIEINYLKVGSGPKTLLLLPGALGSIYTDFKPQIENLSRKKYTIVVWDPPGYGFSRPPSRDCSSGFFYRDAEYVVTLMDALNINQYSLIGWSDGGITALIAASQAVDKIQNVIVWGSNTYLTDKDIKLYEKIRDIKKWSPKMRQPFINLYGEEYFAKTWSSLIDAYRAILEENKGDICCGELSKIEAPTLVLHGSQDPLVPIEHPVYIHKNLKYASLEIFPDGKHNIHLRYPEKFNSSIENFLSKLQ